jgi:hypothetical protein
MFLGISLGCKESRVKAKACDYASQSSQRAGSA